MKKLSEILNEETSDEFLAKMMASWEKAKVKLKSMGFERAPIGPKTHQVLIGKSKIEDLYGIPMRAGYWADVFFATMYDTKTPWCVIDREGRDCYANLDDAMKALQKRMRTIKEEAYTNYGDFAKQHKKMYPSHTEEQTKTAWEKYKKMTYTAQVRQMNKDDRTNRAAAWGKVFSNLRKEEVEGDESLSQLEEVYTNYNDFAKQHKKMYPKHDEEQMKAAWEVYKNFHSKKEEVEGDEEVDATGEALLELEDICEMADELYETLSDLDEIDSETRESIAKIYSALDDLYETVDKKYEVAVDTDEYEEVNEEVDMTRFKQLASTGLVSRDELPKLVLAMRALDADKPLSMSQKDLINSTFQSLIAIVTGDTSVLSKVKSSIANN